MNIIKGKEHVFGHKVLMADRRKATNISYDKLFIKRQVKMNDIVMKVAGRINASQDKPAETAINSINQSQMLRPQT
jgi:hypothetical protein